mmetsp:Transcript_3247/g.9984  ORF Transcript_3247/g.9984 Transcript_3247/m.9984 type:complete len:335 (+) Transcript_3247:1368-2372(+)|eukprot:scaffold269587_cov30-Tisochrysis_lutea.AAC.3
MLRHAGVSDALLHESEHVSSIGSLTARYMDLPLLANAPRCCFGRRSVPACDPRDAGRSGSMAVTTLEAWPRCFPPECWVAFVWAEAFDRTLGLEERLTSTAVLNDCCRSSSSGCAVELHIDSTANDDDRWFAFNDGRVADPFLSAGALCSADDSSDRAQVFDFCGFCRMAILTALPSPDADRAAAPLTVRSPPVVPPPPFVPPPPVVLRGTAPSCSQACTFREHSIPLVLHSYPNGAASAYALCRAPPSLALSLSLTTSLRSLCPDPVGSHRDPNPTLKDPGATPALLGSASSRRQELFPAPLAAMAVPAMRAPLPAILPCVPDVPMIRARTAA